jgi:hypothetical protein
MKTVYFVIGIIGVIVGLIWAVQGIRMGVPWWIGSGAWTIAFAAGLMVWAWRKYSA